MDSRSCNTRLNTQRFISSETTFMFYPNKYINIQAAIPDHSFLTDHYDYDFSVFPRGSHDIYILDTLLSPIKSKNV